MKKVIVLLSCCFWIAYLNAQTSLPLNTIVTETFNGIGNTATASLPANWKMSSAGTGATSGWTTGTNVTTTTIAANSGTPATGGRYNWATTANTDRAVGFLTTGSYATPNAVMAHYRNTTGSTVNTITVSFAVERYVVNTGTFSLSFSHSTDGNTWTPQSSGDMSNSDFPSSASATFFSAPKTVSRTVTITIAGGLPNNGDIYFRWVFNTSNTASQGLGLDNVSVFAGTPTPILTAKLRDLLQVDNGTPNQFNEGDVIRYHTVIKNTGTGDANNVQITIPPPSNTTLVGGSIKTSALAVDDSYNASFNTAFSGSSVLANDFGVPLPAAVLTYGTTADATAVNAGVAATTDAGGTITLLADGTFTYTPPTGFSGTDKFKYITGNGNLPNNDAIVNIIVAGDITIATVNTNPLCNASADGTITVNATGGNGTLTYSKNGAAGPYQASNVFTGLTAGTYTIAVKDAGGYIKTTTATLTDPALLVVSGTVPTLTYTTAMATATFTKTGGTGTVSWSASGLPPGLSLNSSTGALTGTPTQTGSFNSIITATDANGCTDTHPITIAVAPKLTGDAYTFVGNTQLVANGHSTPVTPFTADATNIITNDVSDAAITITAVTNAATTGGGTITIDAAGKFTFSPAAGNIATDTYTYTATSNGVSATATITLTPSNMVWYVNNTYAGANGAANGTSHRPFTDVASAATASSVNQTIYVHTGTGNTNGAALLKSGQTLRGAGTALSVGALSIPAGTKPTLTGTVTLANSVTVDGFDMTTGTNAAITNAGNTVTGVTINVGNVTTTTGTGFNLSGSGNSVTAILASLTTNGATNAVNIANTTGTVTINGGSQTGSALGATFNISGGAVNLTYSGGITQGANAAMVNVIGGHTGTLTFNTGTLSATNGTGLQFDNADGTYNFNGTTTLNGGDAGIDILNGSAGTFTFSSNTSITNPSGTAFNIGSATVGSGSTCSVTFNGTISKTSAGRLIEIQQKTGGTVLFAGSVSGTASSTGINLATNTGATINFTGGITLNTGSNAAFAATGGGTVSATQNNTTIVNTIVTTTGTALNVTNTTIGVSGLTFRSINAGTAASGPVNGIVINNTGNTAGLTISGNGGAANSGGIIQKTTGDAISLSSCINISFSDMSLLNNGTALTSSNIEANNVTGLTLTRMTLDWSYGHGVEANILRNLVVTGGTYKNGGQGAVSAGVANYDGWRVTNLLGTCSISGASFSRSNTRQFYLVNNMATVAYPATPQDILTLTGTTWNDHRVGAFFGDHFSVGADNGSNMRIVTNSSGGTNTFDNQGIPGAGIAIQIASNGSGNIQGSIKGVVAGNGTAGFVAAVTGSGTCVFNLEGNTISNTGSVNISVTHTGTGTLEGRIHNNTLTMNAGGGVDAVQTILQGNGTMTVALTNNNLTGAFQRGIRTQSSSGTGTANFTISGNSVTNTDPTGLQCILNEAGASGGGTTNTLRLNMFNNTASGGSAGYRLITRPGYSFQLQNFTGNGSSATDVTNWVNTVKTNTGSVVVSFNTSGVFSASAGNIPTPNIPAGL